MLIMFLMVPFPLHLKFLFLENLYLLKYICFQAITGDSIVLKFERARCALEDSLKRVEDIVPQSIGCQVVFSYFCSMPSFMSFSSVIYALVQI